MLESLFACIMLTLFNRFWMRICNSLTRDLGASNLSHDDKIMKFWKSTLRPSKRFFLHHFSNDECMPISISEHPCFWWTRCSILERRLLASLLLVKGIDEFF